MSLISSQGYHSGDCITWIVHFKTALQNSCIGPSGVRAPLYYRYYAIILGNRNYTRQQMCGLVWKQSKAWPKNTAKRNKKPLVYGTEDMTSPY